MPESRAAVLREKGAPICGCRGRLKLGPWSEGTPHRVRVTMACPADCPPRGVLHSHPYGELRPSTVDVQNLRKHNLPISCVGNADFSVIKCFDVSGRPPRRGVD